MGAEAGGGAGPLDDLGGAVDQPIHREPTIDRRFLASTRHAHPTLASSTVQGGGNPGAVVTREYGRRGLLRGREGHWCPGKCLCRTDVS